MTSRLTFALVLLPTFLAGTASAASVTVRYEVRVTGAFDPDHVLFPTTVAIGDVLGGTYTFDTNAVDEVEPEPFPCCEFGLYHMTGVPFRLTLDGGPSSDPSLAIEVFHFDTSDEFNVTSGFTPPGPYGAGVFEIMLGAPNSHALDSDDLIVPDLDRFTVRSFRLDAVDIANNQGLSFWGTSSR